MTKQEKLYLDLCDKLYNAWTDNYQSEEILPNKTEPKEHTIERISRAIAGASISLESMVPFALRKKRTAYLRMTKDKKEVTVEWYESMSVEPYKNTQMENFESEVTNSGQELGELTLEQSEALSNVFIDYLFTNEKPFLPNYLYVKKEDNSIWFKWLPPREELIKEKLKKFYS